MTPDRFHTLIKGALDIWRVDAGLSFTEPLNRCSITIDGLDVAIISVEEQPFGTVWRIQEPERRERVHASIGPALRGLREILSPDRSAGRVLFISDDNQ
jgi:hypothetical protein